MGPTNYEVAPPASHQTVAPGSQVRPSSTPKAWGPHPGPNLQDRICLCIGVGERLTLSLALCQMYLIAASLEKEGQRLQDGEEREPRWAGAPYGE